LRPFASIELRYSISFLVVNRMRCTPILPPSLFRQPVNQATGVPSGRSFSNRGVPLEVLRHELAATPTGRRCSRVLSRRPVGIAAMRSRKYCDLSREDCGAFSWPRCRPVIRPSNRI
jgi:hypothetical protein